jgi:hypothetical protein
MLCAQLSALVRLFIAMKHCAQSIIALKVIRSVFTLDAQLKCDFPWRCSALAAKPKGISFDK